MERIVLGGDDGITARNKAIKGAKYLAACVKSTLGPGGANFLLEKKNRVTNDGVSVANEIILEDEVENMGAQKMREIATRTNDKVGDATTTAVTLGEAILDACVPKLRQEGQIKGGMAPMKLVQKLTQESKEVVEKLNAKAVKVESEEQLIKVAEVSVEDTELAQLIGKAQWDMGTEGHVMVEEWTKEESVVEHIPGIRVDNGYASSLLINNPEKGNLEVENTPILLTNYSIQDISVLKGLLDNLIATGADRCVIVARGFTEEAVMNCMKNINTPNGFKLFPVNAPFTDQVQVMYDMEAALGGNFINSEERTLDSINVSDIGFASKIVCDRFSCTFVGKETRQIERDARASSLEAKLQSELSEFERKDIGRRISQLKKGISVLKVGGASETDRKYKKDKADDAVNAVRAALEEGVVSGGGIALKEIGEELPDDYILKNALKAPYDQIQTNAGGLEIEPWVQDPVKVVRVAFENACSVASVFSTVLGVVTTKKQKYNAYITNKSNE